MRHGFALAQPQDPRPLDDHTEAELANEIDNERAYMVRGDGQDKVPSSSKVQGDSEQDTIDATEDESDSSYVSADDSLPVSEEEDGTRSTPTVKLQDEIRAGGNWDEELSSIRNVSNSKSRRVQSYQGLEQVQHVSSLMRAQYPSSFRGHAATLSSRHLRMSTLSSAPVPSPSIRSSSSHPDISSLCEQWGSTGPANVTLTYKPGGTIPASSSKSKDRKRSPTFHHI